VTGTQTGTQVFWIHVCDDRYDVLL